MHIGDDVLDQVRSQGFAYIQAFLTPKEVLKARSQLFELVPHPREYHRNPSLQARFGESQFAGILPYPFGRDALDQLGTHEDLVSAAERYCSTTALHLHSVNIWAKYSGAIDYEQTLHRDYYEKTTVVPGFGAERDQLTAFIMLSDIEIDDGPTMFLSRADSEPLGRSFVRRPGLLSEKERAMIGTAGSVYLFDYETVHRASAFRGCNRSRFILACELVRADRPWLARTRWVDRARTPNWQKPFAALKPRERQLFGVPAPDDPYWTPALLEAFLERHPGVDSQPYIDGLGRRASLTVEDRPTEPHAAVEPALVRLRQAYAAAEPHDLNAFPFVDGASALAAFDRSLVDRLTESFSHRPFQLVAITALQLTPSQMVLIESGLDRNSLLGSIVDARWPQYSAIVPLVEDSQSDTEVALTLRIDGKPFDVPIGSAAVIPSDAVSEVQSRTAGQHRLTFLIIDFSLRDAPGVGFTTWWMTADWKKWRSFVVSMPVDLLPLIGFPPPSDAYWDSQTASDVAARFPGLDLFSYLSNST